ncbi:MAG: TIR and AAA domain-containing protein [Verrucomicrobiota bacterium]
MSATPPMRKEVFISYRNENPEHERKVRVLGQRLRDAGLPVVLDQFFLEDNPGGPDGGWRAWCEDHAQHSACVVVVGSQGWYDAYAGKQTSHSSRGSASEARVIGQILYDDQGINKRFRMVFLDKPSKANVPPTVSGWHQFEPLEDSQQFKALARWIGQTLGMRPTVSEARWPEPDAGFTPNIADRVRCEWPSIVRLCSGSSRERIVLLSGDSGLGKTCLLRETVRYARERQVAVAEVSLNSFKDIQAILDRLALDLEPKLTARITQEWRQPLAFWRSLRTLPVPVVIVLDQYEAVAKSPEVVHWINQLLDEVEKSPGLAVIVGGQSIPERTHAPWRDNSVWHQLGPILDPNDWKPWVEKKYPRLGVGVAGNDWQTLVAATEGRPDKVIPLFDVLGGRP